jgi:Flp pilus assembly protein TadB
MKVGTHYLLQLNSQPTSVGILEKYTHYLKIRFAKNTFFLKSLFVKNVSQTLETLHWSAENFIVQKMIMTTLGSVFALVIIMLAFSQVSPFLVFLGLLIGGFGGWSICDILLKDQATLHSLSIQRAVPDFFDQLSMVVAAPGFDSLPVALHQVSKNFPGILGSELRRLDKLSLYVSHQDFFTQLAKTIPHPLTQELTVTVKIHQEFGGDLSQKIFELGQTARTHQTQKAKDFANKASGLLLGPLLLFHLPALLILFLIPAVLAFTKSL